MVQAQNVSQIIDFSKEDEDNPRNWSRARKMLNVGIIAFMAGIRSGH